MKKFIFFIIMLFPLLLSAQIGIKAGLNFAKVSSAADINSSNKSGFHAGLFLAPPSQSILSSRTELLFSRQGYDYKTSTKTGEVNLDYIQMAQFMSINITRFVSLMFGAQTSYLLNAKVDSTTNGSGGSSGSGSGIMNLYNKFDYGYAIGAEVHPLKGLIVGARYNVSLSKLYNDVIAGQSPSFTSEDAKNNVIHISVGWRFGSTKKPGSKPAGM